MGSRAYRNFVISRLILSDNMLGLCSPKIGDFRCGVVSDSPNEPLNMTPLGGNSRDGRRELSLFLLDLIVDDEYRKLRAVPLPLGLGQLNQFSIYVFLKLGEGISVQVSGVPGADCPITY
jgi:hypothetical protein